MTNWKSKLLHSVQFTVCYSVQSFVSSHKLTALKKEIKTQISEQFLLYTGHKSRVALLSFLGAV